MTCNIRKKFFAELLGTFFLVFFGTGSAVVTLLVSQSIDPAGVGIGIATTMYFLNLIANITDAAEFLKYITPFGYCEGADILSKGGLDTTLVVIGMVLGIGGIIIAFLKYTEKDIH